mgnify:CR=1 FL=1
MCGRFAVTTDPAKLAAEIDAVNEVPASAASGPDDAAGTAATDSGQSGAGSDDRAARPLGTNYNVAPTTTILTVVERHSHDDPHDDPRLRVRAMRWGLVPSWAKEVGKGPLLFNARAETAAEKSSFRTSVKSKRCLVPMDGWYEWKPGPADSRGKPTKIPFFMSPKDGTRLFMAGLWSAWHDPTDPDAPPLLSCTILTTDAVLASDVVITMGCGDACPIFPGKRYEDWTLDDPAGQGVEAVRPIRDNIRARVSELLDSLGIETVEASS